MLNVQRAGFALGSLSITAKEMLAAWGDAPRGITSLRVPAWDEDATTLAIAAALEALEGASPSEVIAVGDIDAGTLRTALGFAADTPVRLVADARDALTLAARASAPVLVLAAHTPPLAPGTEAMRGAGAGAVALLFTDGAATTSGAAWPDTPSTTGDLGACVPLIEAARAAKVGPRHAPAAGAPVSPTRALSESRALAPEQGLPDVPMGAYVPEGTWLEDLPARLRLIAQQCRECGRVAYPPRGACPACRGTTFDERMLEGARVYVATRIGAGGAPSEFALEQTQTGAYWVAVVEWPEERVRVTARLADVVGEPAIGMPLRPVVRRLFAQEGRVRYGLKFAPQ